MKAVHVVQHTSAEYLGLIEDHLEGRGVRFFYYRPFTEKKTMPKAESLADGLILLGGGPWGSAGTRDLPTLKQEIALAETCLSNGWPVIGIGLGAQMLALAAGGKSESAPLVFEIGTAKRMDPGGLEGYLPESYPLAIYMRDRAVPPRSASILAADECDRPALWQIGKRALGFSGHPGLKLAMVEDLVMEFEESPAEAATGLEKLRRVQRALEDSLVPIMTGVVKLAGWMA